jgi:hypothetical protein
MPKFRVKPKRVEARQWDGDFDAMSQFCDPQGNPPCDVDGVPLDVVIGVGIKGKDLVVFGTQGQRVARRGDWVVKKPNNDINAVAAEKFSASFEEDVDLTDDHAREIALASARSFRDEPDSKEWPPRWVLHAITAGFDRGRGSP